MKKTLGILFILISAGIVHAQTQIDTLADKMLRYQLPVGAWSKQLADKSTVNYSKPIDKSLADKIRKTTDQYATIDNKATSREIEYLIQAYHKTKNPNYLKAVERGIEYLLKMQYPNGGFPQYYPNASLYRGEITYNDNAMINALDILYNVSNKLEGYEVVRSGLSKRAQDAVNRGLDCILKTQVRQKGTLTIWAAQYDQNTLQPAKARNFEPASLSTSESMGVVKFLMRLEQPSAEVIQAVKSAKKWFETNDIEGYRFDFSKDPETNKPTRQLVKDPDAVVWARFYDLKDNRPIFGDRDNSIKYNLSEVSEERRNGYAWYGVWPLNFVQKDYQKWIKKNKIEE